MQINNKIKAVIWDMGGVIMKTEDSLPRENLAKRLGISRLALEDLIYGSESGRQAENGTITDDEHWNFVAASLGLSREEIGKVKTEFWAGDRIDQKIVNFIRSLRPSFLTGLLSNAWLSTRAEITKYFDFLDIFDVVIFSAEVGMSKPDPSIYQLITEKLGISASEAVFMDDLYQNIKVAQKLGMNTIHFKDTDETLSQLNTLLGIPE